MAYQLGYQSCAFQPEGFQTVPCEPVVAPSLSHAYALIQIIPKFPEVSKVRREELHAVVTGINTIVSNLTMAMSLSAEVTASSVCYADLGENVEARKRYKRRKEQEVIAFMLLAA